MPIIRRIRPCPTACGFLPGCVGCGWLWSCGAGSCTTQLKSAPTCFWSQRIHHHGALYSRVSGHRGSIIRSLIQYCFWSQRIHHQGALYSTVSGHRGSLIREPYTVLFLVTEDPSSGSLIQYCFWLQRIHHHGALYNTFSVHRGSIIREHYTVLFLVTEDPSSGSLIQYCFLSQRIHHRARRSSTRPQPTTAYTSKQNTACSRTRSYSPDDGHNDAETC